MEESDNCMRNAVLATMTSKNLELSLVYDLFYIGHNL